jgi:hypothetical protein
MNVGSCPTAVVLPVAILQLSITGAGPMDDDHDSGSHGLVIAILAVVAVGAIVDVVLDAPERLLTLHVLLELGLAGFSIGMIVLLARRWRRTQQSLLRAEERLEQGRAEREEWRGRTSVLHPAVQRPTCAAVRQTR